MNTDSSSQDDPKKLMQLAKEGDKEAYGRIYELYFVPIFRYIYFRVKDKDVANDLTQTVFLKVFSALPNFKEQDKSPLAYFYTVSRNAVIDYWRAKNNARLENSEEILLNIPDKSENQLEIMENKEIGEAVRRAIHGLTEIQQDVIILKFINDMPNKDIAELLGKSEEAVRQLQSRAIKALRQIMKNGNFI